MAKLREIFTRPKIDLRWDFAHTRSKVDKNVMPGASAHHFGSKIGKKLKSSAKSTKPSK